MAIEDPFETLDNPQLVSPEFYGQMKLDVYFCILEKGVGKVDFDPNKHALDQRRTAIKLMLIPLPEHNAKYDIMRDQIAESKEWAGLVLPSIKSLGLASVRELQDKWVKISFQPTGRSYTKTDPNTGETVTKDASTFKFLALYPNKEACRAAYQAERGSNGNGHEQASGNGSQAAGNTGATATSPVAKEKETALKFVKALVAKHNGAEAPIGAAIAAMPLLAKHFTVESPEVQQLINEYLFEQMQRATA